MKNVLLATMLLVGTPAMWCAGDQGRNNPVQLRDAVEVKRNRVWLFDLLPADASLALQKLSASIELCPAPQPGSVRVLDAGQITAKLARQPELLRQLAIPSHITIRYAGWPIAEERVRAAISQFLRQPGSHTAGGTRSLPEAARVEWAQALSATEEHPALQVVNLSWDDRQQSIEVRLRCSTRAACASFLVDVILPPPRAEEWRRQLGLSSSLNSPGSQPQSSTLGDGPALAEKGKPATLVLDDGSMRISLRVICLQRGVLNQQIRVVEARSRHVFRAEVIGVGLLHASL
jgi:hypothetical protein